MGNKDTYKAYLNSLARFMASQGLPIKPYPRIVLRDDEQEGVISAKTGYYDPEYKTVVLFTHGRHMKDVLRSCAHELIHHMQNMEGRLTPDAYNGEAITEDDKLQTLEEEAYKKGNIFFRRWTEMEGKKGGEGLT